jgi:hypothetical protein
VRLEVSHRLEEIGREEWNRVAGTANPFLRHEFLSALERHGCLGDHYGWWPRHLVLRDGPRLVGAAPAYLKANNYGEFVFDHAWSDAYARAGLAYYPKLVVAVPYTPVAGPRLLLAPEAGPEAARALIEGARELVAREGLSSAHWLFTDDATTAVLEAHGCVRRVGCQFHWTNPGYRDFEDFLEALSAKRRKEVRRERREVAGQGIEVDLIGGAEAEPGHWEAIHHFYRSTFDRKWGVPTLTREFFEAVGRDLPGSVLLVLARKGRRYVAGAFNLVGSERLYGRHWGTEGFFPGLHFEVCYYRAIEYCIERGLGGFEAGAQGEHKVARGFLPTLTYSAHWIEHAGFRAAVADFVARERRAVEAYAEEVGAHSPYRATAGEPGPGAGQSLDAPPRGTP